MNRPPAFLVAGTHSGVGKTTVSFALMALLKQKGFMVQPFKVGPDFIDGGYHRLATRRDSINLDLWMMGRPGVQESFEYYARTADVSVIEGMGALFDGKNGTVEGSSADLSKGLKVPIVLVVDIWGMTVTTGAILGGIIRFDPRVNLAGIILNRAGSRGHFDMVMKSLEPALRKKVTGYLRHSPEFEIPERHLGLKTLEENKKASRVLEAVRKAAGQTIDVQKLIQVLKIQKKVGPAFRTPLGAIRRSPIRPVPPVRIGLAKDAAFSFYYAENLKMLREAGAELVPFSPVKNMSLPKVDGLYIGGGYPESFPKQLSANRGLKREIIQKVRQGMPVYAECGGLMYLSQSLTNFDGKTCPMVGAVPLKIRMDPRRLTIRYVGIQTREDTLLGPKGTKVRGQEFHQSRIVVNGYNGKPAYQVETSTGEKFTGGFKVSNLLASYIHLHFKSNPSVPAFFVHQCQKYRASRGT
jgi:cobyrinic acid a,c-diamide synthase